MIWLVWILAAASAALAAAVIYEKRRQRRTLQRLKHMLEDARSGHFEPGSMDESLMSAMENDMCQFLQESMLAEENLQTERDQIQKLISDISHQTVTPLSNIMLYSQLLEEGLEGMPQQPQAEAVRKQAEKLDFLITSLVKSSRLETGIIKTEPAPCDLFRLLESVAEQAAAKAEEKDILLRLEEPEEPVFALCDGKWTREACFNLVDNAVKYTGSGGRVELSVTGYSMFARIDVKDSGSGIAEEEIPRIFGRFYRSRQAAQEEGVGLGLYLARQIVECQGGYIKVTSKPGQGSCFSVFLPKASKLSKL